METLSTPGVYVEEISTLPASIAQVPSAIPAFLGYTERMPGKELEPKTIGSLAEYRELFGEGAPVEFTRISLNNNNDLDGPPEFDAPFHLYDSIRMFYQNGGGECIIVPLGDYSTTPKLEHFNGGLDVLVKEQDPTLIVLADAVTLGDKLYTVQQSALAHCNDLKNRFCIFDLHDKEGNSDEFRDNIGLNHSKFGSAYTPWLETVLTRRVSYRMVKDVLERNSTKLDLSVLNSDAATAGIISNIEAAIDELNALKTVCDAALFKDDLKLIDKFKSLVDAVRMAADDATRNTSFAELISNAFYLAEEINKAENASPSLSSKFAEQGKIKKLFEELVNPHLSTELRKLIAIISDGKLSLAPSEPQKTALDKFEIQPAVDGTPEKTSLDNMLKKALPNDAGDKKENINACIPFITKIVENMVSRLEYVLGEATRQEAELESGLRQAFPLYRNLISKLENGVVVPPSGAIAGIFASVDANRGVWKAPANVSLSGVSGLKETIDDNEQGKLNVDVNSGLSINAIRAFKGKGILVWGARTLAGNDNEWRYVPVRRLFIMVEESIRRSTNWVVFEPNDANTWIKVKAMIENYLTGLWRDGGLAGSTPEQAFYVNVGLGTSMTPLDILEGRMKIDIGMAAVRPAEFVILQFSHKLQEA